MDCPARMQKKDDKKLGASFTRQKGYEHGTVGKWQQVKEIHFVVEW